MRLALDGRTLQSRPLGGVGRALRGALGALPDAAGPAGLELDGVDVLVDGRLPWPDCDQLPPGAEVHALRSAPAGRGLSWLQVAVPRWLATAGRSRGVGLFHCPFYGLPYRQPVPMVVSLYDLTFLDRGHWFRPSSRLAFRAQARHAGRSARAVITGSETVAAEIRRSLGVEPDRLTVAPPGVDAVFLEAGQARADRAPARVWRRPYLVAMGGATRRNLPVAVAAWEHAGRSGADVDLVVVGSLTPAEDLLVRSSPEVRVEGPVPDAVLARLLGDATAFLYPTAYEGFGLPALEAAAAGAPVVCAPVGALPEVLGDDAEWCERSGPAGPTVAAVAAALARLLGDPERAERIGSAGRGRVAGAPGHAGAARAWATAYRRALEG